MRMDSLSLNYFRLRLGEMDALPQWILLGLISGGLTAAIIIAFRLALPLPLELLAALNQGNGFDGLEPLHRLMLPVTASVLIGLLFWRTRAASVGITHVLERLSYHQGRMPAGNLISQFLGGVLMLGSGHSGGREGPAVHLGAAVSSLLGQRLRLPNNSLRTLVACGTAAAIAASFNTPIAGIIFAMEVVMMEYSVLGFIPVLVASVTAALILQMVLGDETHFLVPDLDIQTLGEIPFIIALGLAIGVLAVVFSLITTRTAQHIKLPIITRLILAGITVGTAGLFLPEVMGIGYDSLTRVLNSEHYLPLEFLLTLTLLKLAVTAVSIGLGAPIGLIGPCLLIGATAGCSIGLLGIEWAQQPVADAPFYAMLGMGAMMAAVLQAPLAALLALLELTMNPNIIFPGMVAIIAATVCHRLFIPRGSIFQSLLHLRGLDWRSGPLEHFLESTSALALKRPFIVSVHLSADPVQAQRLTEQAGEWLLLNRDGIPRIALAKADLQLYLSTLKRETQPGKEVQPVDLLGIPAQRRDLTTLSYQATLKEALAKMNSANLDALCLLDLRERPCGLLFREDIERHFQSAPQP